MWRSKTRWLLLPVLVVWLLVEASSGLAWADDTTSSPSPSSLPSASSSESGASASADSSAGPSDSGSPAVPSDSASPSAAVWTSEDMELTRDALKTVIIASGIVVLAVSAITVLMLRR